MAERDMLTVTEAAALLGIETSVLRRRLRLGIMDAVQVNPRLWLIPRDEVERWKGKGKLRPGRKPKQAAT
jgi:excisionase family DNA binding protein